MTGIIVETMVLGGSLSNKEDAIVHFEKFGIQVAGYRSLKPEGFKFFFVKMVLTGDPNCIDAAIKESECEVQRTEPFKSIRQLLRNKLWAKHSERH